LRHHGRACAAVGTVLCRELRRHCCQPCREGGYGCYLRRGEQAHVLRSRIVSECVSVWCVCVCGVFTPTFWDPVGGSVWVRVSVAMISLATTHTSAVYAYHLTSFMLTLVCAVELQGLGAVHLLRGSAHLLSCTCFVARLLVLCWPACLARPAFLSTYACSCRCPLAEQRCCTVLVAR
jgi:hypothetical protein